MADWTPTVCHMLMQMAKRSLYPGGKLIINEVSTATLLTITHLLNNNTQATSLNNTFINKLLLI
jgi:hypothetical protein